MKSMLYGLEVMVSDVDSDERCVLVDPTGDARRALPWVLEGEGDARALLDALGDLRRLAEAAVDEWLRVFYVRRRREEGEQRIADEQRSAILSKRYAEELAARDAAFPTEQEKEILRVLRDDGGWSRLGPGLPHSLGDLCRHKLVTSRGFVVHYRGRERVEDPKLADASGYTYEILLTEEGARVAAGLGPSTHALDWAQKQSPQEGSGT